MSGIEISQEETKTSNHHFKLLNIISKKPNKSSVSANKISNMKAMLKFMRPTFKAYVDGTSLQWTSNLNLTLCGLFVNSRGVVRGRGTLGHDPSPFGLKVQKSKF